MKKEFDAVIQKVPDKNGAYIEIPFDVEKVFGAKRVKVKAMFDAAEYRGSIVKMGLPCYMIGMTQEIRKQIQKDIGELVHVVVERDEEERTVEMPEEFLTRLREKEGAQSFYESLSFSAKRKYAQWITGAKKEETRQKRIQEAIEKLENKIKL